MLRKGAGREPDPRICDKHFFVQVAGLGWRCWSCGLPQAAIRRPHGANLISLLKRLIGASN
jgi:hypothetical protein